MNSRRHHICRFKYYPYSLPIPIHIIIILWSVTSSNSIPQSRSKLYQPPKSLSQFLSQSVSSVTVSPMSIYWQLKFVGGILRLHLMRQDLYQLPLECVQKHRNGVISEFRPTVLQYLKFVAYPVAHPKQIQYFFLSCFQRFIDVSQTWQNFSK